MPIAFVTGGSGFVGRNLIAILKERGDTVRALARSERAAEVVSSLGAEPVHGDLNDASSILEGLKDADIVYHSAAYVEDWGDPKIFHQVNVEGTRCLLQQAQKAGVSTFVHVSTEAVLVDGTPIVQADETRPLPQKPLGLYAKTKGLAEKVVLEESDSSIKVVIVRPRFIWGKGDTSLLEEFITIVEQGQYSWISGGRYLTSTCHVRNTCEGMLLAGEKGQDKGIYFLTDGSPVEFRSFVTSMLEARGIDPGKRSIPRPLARLAGWLVEKLWTIFPISGRPPLTGSALRIMGEEVTVIDDKARRELGYQAKVCIEQGLEEMRQANHPSAAS